jgi:ribosomal protein S18 acetylase RimI-like enzyme
VSHGILSLRPTTDADLEFLLHVYASTREDELRRVDWTPAQKAAFVRQQFDAQHKHWQEHYTNTSWDVVLLDGHPVGRLYVARWPSEIRVVDVALLPEARGSGVGTRLLRELFAEADAARQPVRIHVEVFNPARRLYERLGFVRVEDTGVYILMERAPAVAEGTGG